MAIKAMYNQGSITIKWNCIVSGQSPAESITNRSLINALTYCRAVNKRGTTMAWRRRSVLGSVVTRLAYRVNIRYLYSYIFCCQIKEARLCVKDRSSPFAQPKLDNPLVGHWREVAFTTPLSLCFPEKIQYIDWCTTRTTNFAASATTPISTATAAAVVTSATAAAVTSAAFCFCCSCCYNNYCCSCLSYCYCCYYSCSYCYCS